jgi:sialate O-acetylesterase
VGSLKVSRLFADGMVLQQGVQIPLAGESDPEAEITVSLSSPTGEADKTYRTRANPNGKWQVLLDSQTAGGPYTIKISDIQNVDTICIYNIYFGDVWVCSGQSNMEMPMQRVRDNFPEEWDSSVNSLIRQFKVPQEWDFSGPRDDFPCGRWAAASRENLHEFSATAWFFANALFENHHAPLGLITAAWGGTPVEAWMSREALAAFPEKIASGEQYANTIVSAIETADTNTTDDIKTSSVSAFCEEIARNSEAAIKGWYDGLNAGDGGLTQDWHKPDQWGGATDGTLTLPGDFSQTGIDNFCGSIWLCREFDVDEAFVAKSAAKDIRIWLGTIVDSDTVFVNGVEVGNTGYRYPPRKYAIPAGLLRAGKNHIVIRVVCNNGQGGVTKDKPFKIFSGCDSIELGGTWDYRIGVTMTGPCPEAFFFQRQPMGLFNAQIAPMLKFPCKGIIWYQGESNDPNPREYAALFTAFIEDWRGKIQCLQGGETLPFLFVQLPIFGEPNENNESASWAILREAQASALSLPATGMAAGLELGEWNDLHPMDKKGIGRRLALAAEKLVYKAANTAPGPLLRGGVLREGRLLLNFDNCGAGLAARAQPYVSVIADGASFRLPAVIEGADGLSVDISSIANAEKVLYAWANNPLDRVLYNADGLPMIPFRALIAEFKSCE